VPAASDVEVVVGVAAAIDRAEEVGSVGMAVEAAMRVLSPWSVGDSGPGGGFSIVDCRIVVNKVDNYCCVGF
jgi:hypothetical protein